MAKEKKEVKLKSEKVQKRETRIKVLKIAILLIILFLIILYFILRVIYETGAFTVSLDPNLEKESGLVMYERLENKQAKQILSAEELEFMDNISVNWLPQNLNTEGEGSHNGKNYLAYSFYIENQGVETINYWYSILIDDVIKDVDEAIRVMVYRNDERTIYAKANNTTNEPEEGTEEFYSDDTVVLKPRENFNPGDIDKFTIVIYLEGDDPECLDNIIGGEMKMHMDITEEHIEA